MSNTNIDDLTREDLLTMFRRERFVRGQMEQRVGSLIAENIEMVGIIQDMQNDLTLARQQVLAHGHDHSHEANGEVTTPAEVAPSQSSS
jgi:hypothetical protein